ncbi:MAG: hypothetical protein HY914_17200 [Desulfomonile tiedjei]|nr:hypothetical protein [Desulfomonile tiedjei]
MVSAFHEFSDTYDEFSDRFPDHPLLDEVRNHLLHRRYPSDDWLKARTKKMKQLMVPVWLRAK